MSTRTRDADDRLATIRSLLAKAEATPFPDEADAFNAKAAELMARYAVDEAMVWGTAPPDPSDIVEVHLDLHPPFASQKLVMVCGIAAAQGCMALQIRAAGRGRPAVVSIVGLAGAVAATEALVTSLLVQLATAMSRADAARPTEVRAAARPSDTAAWRRSFIVGFGGAIIARLETRRKAIIDAATASDTNGAGTGGSDASSVALVLARHDGHVRSEFARRYPFVRTTRISAGSSRTGRRAGAHAGERADLGDRQVAGNAALPRG